MRNEEEEEEDEGKVVETDRGKYGGENGDEDDVVSVSWRENE